MTIIEELKEYLKEKKYPLSKVAKAVNMSNATLHLWINNNYKGNVKKIEDAVSKFLEIDRMREKRIKVDFIKTSIVEDIFDIAQTCHVENESEFVVAMQDLVKQKQRFIYRSSMMQSILGQQIL